MSIPPFLGHKSIETFPVYATINGSKWRIPRNYLESATLERTDGYKDQYSIILFLYIIITYPNFQGATGETLRCLGIKSCPAAISIATPEFQRGPDANKYIDRFYSAKDSIYGLKIVQMNAIRYIYAGHPLKDSDEIVVISCTSKSDNIDELRFCDVSFKIFGVNIWYSFSADILPQWKEIHNGVVNLLTSFHIGDDR